MAFTSRATIEHRSVGQPTSLSWRTASAALSASLVDERGSYTASWNNAGSQHGVDVVDRMVGRQFVHVPAHPHDMRGRVVAAMRLAMPGEQPVEDGVVMRAGHASPHLAQLGLGGGHRAEPMQVTRWRSV